MNAMSSDAGGSRGSVSRQYGVDIDETVLPDRLPSEIEHALLDIHRDDLAGWPRRHGEAPGEVTGTGADVGDGIVWTNLERLHQRVGPLFGRAFGPVEKRNVLGGGRNLPSPLARVDRRDRTKRAEVGDELLDLRRRPRRHRRMFDQRATQRFRGPQQADPVQTRPTPAAGRVRRVAVRALVTAFKQRLAGEHVAFGARERTLRRERDQR